MYHKKLLSKFFKEIAANNLLTSFINDVFEYHNLNDYNYIYRFQEEADKIIIDIYDNISQNRFNRYIFLFNSSLTNRVEENNNVYITYLNVSKTAKDSQLGKLCHLFTLAKEDIIPYAKSFLEQKYLNILIKIIK